VQPHYIWLIHCTWISFLCRLVTYVRNMNLTFKYEQLHNILSQTYIYIKFLTKNDIKATISSI